MATPHRQRQHAGALRVPAVGYVAVVGPRGAYRAVLRVREARALIGASAVSQVGDWLYNAVLLGYVYEATGSAACSPTAPTSAPCC